MGVPNYMSQATVEDELTSIPKLMRVDATADANLMANLT
jgi:hypothetical protein